MGMLIADIAISLAHCRFGNFCRLSTHVGQPTTPVTHCNSSYVMLIRLGAFCVHACAHVGNVQTVLLAYN